MLRLLAIALALILLVAGALAWSGGGTSKPADFTFISQRDINTLDPNQMSYLQDIRITYAIREGLYSYDGQSLEPKPAVASGFDLSPDKKIYTFHLRPDARWSNGDPVVAGDFLFAWQRMLDSPAEYTYLHYYIEGAEDYVGKSVKGESVDFKNVGVKALDSHTLQVTLHDPVPFMLDLMAYTPFYPLHERSMAPFKQVDLSTGKVTYNQSFTRPPGVVTNGAFNLISWDFKRRLRLEQNTFYWDKANVKCRTVEMQVVEDPLTQIMQYDSGNVDWLAAVPAEVAPELLAMGRKDFHNFAGFGTEFLTVMVRPTFNDGRTNPLADIRVRLALAMAIDKDSIVKNITRMGEQVATTYIPPEIFQPLGWRSTPGIPRDPARARQLLADAGYPNGGTLPGVTFLFRSAVPSSRDEAQTLVRQWKSTLNLDIPLESQELKIVRDRLNKKDYALCAAQWIGDYNDPSTFTDKYLSNSDNNDSGWISEPYDRLCKDAARELDAQKRLRLLEQAEHILNTQIPIIPMFVLTNQYMFRDTVHGINLQPRNTVIFKGVYVDRR